MHFQKPMLGTPLDWSNPLNNGLVMHLAMNEGHGDVVRDLSMNGNHGTLKNMAFPPTAGSGWNPGQTGVGLNFDGTDDYVTCGNDPSLDITDAITISAWIRPESISDYDGICGRGGYDVGFWTATHSNGNVLFYLAGVRNWAISGNSILYDGNWHFVAFTYDKNDGSNNMVFYRDMYSQSETETGSFNSTPNIDVIIGDPYNFAGAIDQVRIYNRALTSKEVKDYYINPWQVYLDEDDD